ncbi:hypothetical protein Vretimale_8490 [Volvox reticuliferus]|uniref:Uncharacterized protein n=1 Tax=Volvox reticuliferus TaxID=1737510 RepID=A0A8J4CH57_9CHLO|nr:hypothetical protein Vretifemale_11653 [Volvox reticuliferus]GIM03800.1 hypothetical protein Vretimale_8490 [Volvox reticuliferus]
MRLLQRCQQLLRGASYAADQGNAVSLSGIQSWQATIIQLGQPRGLTINAIGTSVRQHEHYVRRFAPEIWSNTSYSLQVCSTWSALPWAAWQARGLFGAPKPKINPQIHTHEKYKKVWPQPEYKYLQGRFVVDRNDVIWHRQANYRHKRYCKSASQLTRLKRWKPLASSYTSKLLRLGFRERYWAPPDPQDVPGYHEQPGGVKVRYKERRRRSAVPDLNQTTGDPSLRQSWKVPPRQGFR